MQNSRVWEMAQTLAPTALPEDTGLIPGTNMVVHSHLNPVSGGSKTLFWSLLAPGTHMVHRLTSRQNTHWR